MLVVITDLFAMVNFITGSQIRHFTWLPVGQVYQILYLPGPHITSPAKFLHLIIISYN